MSPEEPGRSDGLDPERDRARGLSEAERELLGFAAGRSLVLVSHLRELLGLREAAVVERAGGLVDSGLLAPGPQLRYQAGCYRITRAGLDAIGSGLSEPGIDLRGYWREIAAGWLWIRARAGALGPAERMYTEREMRAADENQREVGLEDEAGWSEAILAKVSDASFGLRLDLDGIGESGMAHYPDLMLVFPAGRAAVELELEPTPPARLERIIAAHQRKATVAAVMFLAESPDLAPPIQAAAARLGISDRVHVQPLTLDRMGR